MVVRIQVYGPVAEPLRVERALQEALPEARVRFTPIYPDSLPPLSRNELSEIDVVVCFLKEIASDTRPANAGFIFLLRLLRVYPYVPVVVVGEPAQHRRAFYKMRAARYLDPDKWYRRTGKHCGQAGRPLTLLGAEVKHAQQAAWWSGVNQFDIPALLVEFEGRKAWIIRANAAARCRWDGLDGASYRKVVEGAHTCELPDGHPLLDTWIRKEGISRYHEYPAAGRSSTGVFLVSTPIVGPRNEIRAVAVLFIEMARWKQIFENGTKLLAYTTLESLYGAIVTEAKALGFGRVRLYSYDPATAELVGVASEGMASPFSEDFIGFRFPIEADEPSKDTKDRQSPRVCIYDGDENPSSPCLVDLEHHYPGRPRFERELDKVGVNRWIDVPLLLPGSPTEPSGSFWGKLSIDNKGVNTKPLDAREAADLALFASIAAGAIHSVCQRVRQEEFRKKQEESRDRFQKVVYELYHAYWEYEQRRIIRPPRQEVGGIKEVVLSILLRMYLELTGADVVLYLGPQRDNLILVDHLFNSSRTPTVGNPTLPREVPRVVLQEAESGRRPRLVNNARTAEVPKVRTREPGWAQRHEKWLEFIGSVATVPISPVGVELRGFFIAVNERDGVYPPALDSTLWQFMYLAEMWLEFAHLYDSREWWVRSLNAVVSCLPRLAEAQTDASFFAALALLLSAHNGLRWNRVMVFNCFGTPTGRTAELQHAVGGLGEPTHGLLQDRLGQSNRTLEDLMKERIEDPIPSFEGKVDSLYALLVADRARRGDNLIHFHFGPDAPPDEAEYAASCINPLKPILDVGPHYASRLISPLDPSRDKWMTWMNTKHHPNLFKNEVYAFPLWCADLTQREPLALILVDMMYAPALAPRDVLPVTRVFLDLASEIFASRRYRRLIRGWLPFLPNLYHGRGLREAWSDCKAKLRYIPHARHQETIREILAGMDAKVKEYYDKHLAMEKCLGGETAGLEVISDLGAHLSDLARQYSRRYRSASPGDQRTETPEVRIEGEWDDVKDFKLPCDKVVFNEVFRILVENAMVAATEQARETGQVLGDLLLWVRARLVPDPSRHFQNIVRLEITDNGPGVKNELKGLIFLSGFSYHRSLLPGMTHRGMGLAYARALLTSYHGNLELLYAKTPSHSDVDDPGATFILTFAVPYEESDPGLEQERLLSPRILVASSSAAMQKSVRDALYRGFGKVDVHESGDLSNHAAKSLREFSLIIVDCSPLDESSIAIWQNQVRLLKEDHPSSAFIYLIKPAQVPLFRDWASTPIIEITENLPWEPHLVAIARVHAGRPFPSVPLTHGGDQL